MIRILHAADLHLDSPFQALGREKAAQRRAEQWGMLARLGELAKEQRADMVLLAGDLFDADSPFSETARMLEQVLPAMEVPVFIAPGNHDWYGPRSPWIRLELGENVHVFSGEDIQCVELPELNARVWGAAFTSRHREPPLAGFSPEKKGDTIIDIMVLHGEVGDPASPYGAITEQQLAHSGMDYVALGHNHTYSGLRRAGDTFYAWPGCPEGRGFDETGEKGVVLAEVEKGACRARFLPLGGRRYEELTVDVTGGADPSAVMGAVDRDPSRDVYRITLTGTAAEPPDMTGLKNALEGKFFALELRDETRLPRDVWEGREAVSLRGLYLDKLWQQYQAAQSDEERQTIELAARYGLAAMENGEEPPLSVI